jgi:protein ImuB
LSAALALSESLEVLSRSPRTEQASLESLAIWAQRITSTVSIEPPESFLLEIAGSLKLFRGLAEIKRILSEEVESRRISFSLSVAPTALGALWLAREESPDVLSLDELPGRLGALPLRVTRWPSPVHALLTDMGVRTIGDCLRLPRDGFARRVGERYLHDLDKALGKQRELRPELQTPRYWSSITELAAESSSCAVCLAAAEKMLDALIADLRRQQVQIQNLRLILHHLRRSPTIETFDLVEPVHHKERLLNLLDDRLECIVLPAPVIAVGLTTGILQSLRLQEAGFFGPDPEQASANVLIERLQGRLGVEDVYRLRVVAEHRPEFAWRKSTDELAELSNRGAGAAALAAEASGAGGAGTVRPLWVLPAPLSLSSNAAQLYYQGTLKLRSGPERIESGWWDGHDVRRDYYTAIGVRGERLWIYQDRRSREWYLHGFFG